RASCWCPFRSNARAEAAPELRLRPARLLLALRADQCVRVSPARPYCLRVLGTMVHLHLVAGADGLGQVLGEAGPAQLDVERLQVRRQPGHLAGAVARADRAQLLGRGQADPARSAAAREAVTHQAARLTVVLVFVFAFFLALASSAIFFSMAAKSIPSAFSVSAQIGSGGLNLRGATERSASSTPSPATPSALSVFRWASSCCSTPDRV